MADKHSEETHVTVTTPQGTQEQGVESGHDDRDIDIRAVMIWLRSLAIMAVVAILAMWGMFVGLSALQEKKDVVPSSLYLSEKQPPLPQPRLLPEPWEALKQETKAENNKIEKYNLADAKGNPKLPDNAVSLVKDAPTQGATANQPTWQTMQEMPSDSSGGTVMEQGKE
jgi:hypothetical protein